VKLSDLHKFVVQPKFVELEVELVLAVERVMLSLLIPSWNRDGAIGPKLLICLNPRTVISSNLDVFYA